MSEKVMLIVPAEIARKIDANRGDLSQAEFINFLIDSRLGNGGSGGEVSKEEVDALKADIRKLSMQEESLKKKYATKEDIQAFQQDTKKLLKNFVDFFVGYGLELGKQSPNNELTEITSRLRGLEEELASEEEGGEVKLKWK